MKPTIKIHIHHDHETGDIAVAVAVRFRPPHKARPSLLPEPVLRVVEEAA